MFGDILVGSLSRFSLSKITSLVWMQVILVGGLSRISSGGTSSTKVKLVSINVEIFPSECRTVFSFHSKTFLPETTQTYSLFWWNLFHHQLTWALFVLGCTMFYLLLHDYVTMCHRKIYPTTRDYYEIYYTCILYIHKLAQITSLNLKTLASG